MVKKLGVSCSDLDILGQGRSSCVSRLVGDLDDTMGYCCERTSFNRIFLSYISSLIFKLNISLNHGTI